MWSFTLNDKYKNLDTVRLAKEAEQLSNNDTLSSAFDKVEEQYLEAMLLASEKDDLGRFRYSEAIKVLRLVKQQLFLAIQDGELSKFELSQMGGKKRPFF